MKTYSVAILSSKNKNYKPAWITNWGQFTELEDIDWHDVNNFVSEDDDYLGYGFYHGHNSRDLSSSRCRTELYLKS